MTNALGAGEHTFTKCSMRGGGGEGDLVTKYNFDNFAFHESNLGNTHFTEHTSITIHRIVFHDLWATKMANLIMESRKYPLRSSNLQAEDT